MMTIKDDDEDDDIAFVNGIQPTDDHYNRLQELKTTTTAGNDDHSNKQQQQ